MFCVKCQKEVPTDEDAMIQLSDGTVFCEPCYQEYELPKFLTVEQIQNWKNDTLKAIQSELKGRSADEKNKIKAKWKRRLYKAFKHKEVDVLS